MENNQTQLIQQVQAYIRVSVTTGFAPYKQIVEDALLEFEGESDTPSWLESKIRLSTKGMFVAHFIKQNDWIHATDCDRLDDAFAELDRFGIIARHNFQCCQEHGHERAEYLMQEHANSYTKIETVGYVFYHQGDTLTALNQGLLDLSFGSYEMSHDGTKEVGNIIADTLTDYGFYPTWNGEPRQRIRINLTWQRRRNPPLFDDIYIP